MDTISLWIALVISWAAVPVGLFAFVHAALHRADAFTAAGKLTKPIWLAITGGGTLFCAIFQLASLASMFWIAGLVAVLVYLVDVRPKLAEVGRGGNRW